MKKDRFRLMREKMVEEQLLRRDINDRRLVEAMLEVPRHRFVPAANVEAAYSDHPLPIGYRQTISQPYMVALMTQELRLKGDECVLEIGTGSGYQTALLAELAKEVYTVERIRELMEKAKALLEEMGYTNIWFRVGDGTLGWAERSPFDAILVTAGTPRVPKELVAQLKDGGRLIIPIGGSFSQMLELIEKKGGEVTSRDITSCVFVPLIGKEGWSGSDDDTFDI